MASLLGDIATPILGALGTTSAGRAQRNGLNAAMGQLQTGAKSATGYQQPIYDQGLQQSQNLAGRYNAGGFAQPTSTAYDPGQFNMNFQEDPGYQFALSQGLKQVQGSAAQSGMLHSPQTTAALTQRAEDIANQQYQNVYERQRGAYESDRNFGQNAQKTAYDQNAQNLSTQFNQGQALANPLYSSANNLSNIQSGLGSNLAELEAQKGGVNANIAAAPYAATAGALGSAPGQSLNPADLLKLLKGGG